MRREPNLTLRGALAILGHHERRLIDSLDKLLGGVILAAGAGAGLASVGAPAAFGTLAAIWGWIEQKNEALRLVRQLLNAASAKLNNTLGVERRQLIIAAHTTIVAAAFFESFNEWANEELDRRPRLSDADKKTLIAGKRPDRDESLVDMLYRAEIPAPSPTRSYANNIEAIERWMSYFGESFKPFLKRSYGLRMRDSDWERVQETAIERYESHYFTLAATVPEFMVWAMLGEHAATQYDTARRHTDIVAALDMDRAALGRVEEFLALQAGQPRNALALCAVVERANRGVLDQPIVPTEAERYGTAVEFPAVRQIYVNPRYRIVRATDDTRPADESWWDEAPSRDDIDLTLAACMTVPDATRLPVLLLGHPGAGKSLLTKVLAARLTAAAGYTAVRVPLRQVGANAPIMEQIQQALDIATHKRVNWWELTEQGHDTVRVVLLDGLDELLQATSNDRSGYLQEVMEFQRIEAEQERPVVVVVTSRTVVADRVDIPTGTTVIQLDYFDEADIEQWLSRWQEANGALIASGKVRELTFAAACRHFELARQPLLLLMLALYSADPASPALDDDLSSADLYNRILDNFARREVAKKAELKLSSHETERRVKDQLDRLSVAALAMFNRGRQDITETELGGDLAALHERTIASSHLGELGQRLIAEFFFVHAAEAQPLPDMKHSQNAPVALGSKTREQPRRSYEFLHATFGEYLVASRVMTELVDVAETALGSRRGPREPDDNLLFALLCHAPLAVRISTLSFAAEIFADLSRRECKNALETLDILISSYRNRHGSDRYVAYQPQQVDRVRQLATYSANLITLRAALRPGEKVPLEKMFYASVKPLEQWRSTAMLWRAGLDSDGLLAILGILRIVDNSLIFSVNKDTVLSAEVADVWFAQLTVDPQLANRVRYGIAICEQTLVEDDVPVTWQDIMGARLIPVISGVMNDTYSARLPTITPPPPGTSTESIEWVGRLVMRLLRMRGSDPDVESSALRFLFDNFDVKLSLSYVFGQKPYVDNEQKPYVDNRAFVAAFIRNPKILETVPEMRNPEIYGEFFEVMFAAFSAEHVSDLKKLVSKLELGPKWKAQLNSLRTSSDGLSRLIIGLIDRYEPIEIPLEEYDFGTYNR